MPSPAQPAAVRLAFTLAAQLMFLALTAGTCAAALRAGIPQAIVWHLGDRKTSGRLMLQRGVAPPPVFHRKISVDWLASTLMRLQSDDGMRASSTALAGELAKERGVDAAVNAIRASIAGM
ncbi:MAG: hypothetical protein ABW133_15180 [Polyangiaceae bacterium]